MVHERQDRGFTIVEVLVTIALVGAMFAVFGVVVVTSALRMRARYDTQAVALAEGGLAAALALPTPALTNRTDAPLIGFTEERGLWQTTAQAGAPSAPNVLLATSSSPAYGEQVSVLRFGDRQVQNGAFSASVRIPADPPAGWRAGLLFRSRDIGNAYRFAVNASSVTLVKLNDGSPTVLYSASGGASPGSWMTLGISGNGATLSLTRDGTPLTTVTDSAFAFGDAALIAEGGVQADFDDVGLSGDATGTWKFDGEVAGGLPADLETFSADDLPGGRSTVTIDRPTADAALTRIVTKISWQTSHGVRSVNATGYAR